MMPSELIDFWRRCDLSHAPYAHPDDWPILRWDQARHIDELPMDFATFVRSSRFGNFDDKCLHLSLLPTPFSGNIEKADIVVLLLNPGFSFSDYYAEYRMPGFQERLQKMIAQDFGGSSFPFIWLGPEICWHGGFHWWEPKLREVVSLIAKKRFGGRYLDALSHLSHRLACVELVPYHSPSFEAHRLVKHLPSVQAAKGFVQGSLLNAAKNGEKTIIVTRQADEWGLEPLRPFVVVYGVGQTRGTRLGIKTVGGQAILSRYGIQAI
jgi:hypothetical protein